MRSRCGRVTVPAENIGGTGHWHSCPPQVSLVRYRIWMHIPEHGCGRGV